MTGTKQLPRGGDAADLFRQHWGAEPGKCQGSQAKGIEEAPLAKLVLGVPTGSAKHQLGPLIGGSVPKLVVSHDIGEGIDYRSGVLMPYFLMR